MVQWTVDAQLRFAVSRHAIEKSCSVFVQSCDYLEMALVAALPDLSNLEFINIAALDVKYASQVVDILTRYTSANHEFVFDYVDEHCNTWMYTPYQTQLPQVGNAGVTSVLQAEEAVLVDSHWKYTGPGTLAYMQYAVEHRPTCGVSVQEMRVSWAICRQDGAISCLYTLPEHRGKNLALQCVVGLMQQFVQFTNSEMTPFCYIVVGNEQSERVFSKLGFTPDADRVTWVCRYKK